MTQADNDNEVFYYKYYTLGTNNPIRVKFNAMGLKVSAEVPDREAQSFKIMTTLLSRIETSPDAEEIDHATFHKMCKDVFKVPDKGSVNPSPLGDRDAILR
jgi:hypothetical protein